MNAISEATDIAPTNQIVQWVPGYTFSSELFSLLISFSPFNDVRSLSSAVSSLSTILPKVSKNSRAIFLAVESISRDPICALARGSTHQRTEVRAAASILSVTGGNEGAAPGRARRAHAGAGRAGARAGGGGEALTNYFTSHVLVHGAACPHLAPSESRAFTCG